MKNILNYFVQKINPVVNFLSEIYLALLLVLIGLLGFGLGRLSKLEDRKVPIIIKSEEKIGDVSGKILGKYLASKTGNSFYLPWCIGAKKIKESNKIWFNTREEALAAGYHKATNCTGL